MPESNSPSWLPDLILFEDYKNEWKPFEEKLYSIFIRDFIKKPCGKVNDKSISVKKHEECNGKHFTFWHLITESIQGIAEEERTPCLRRCERIAWPRSIIDNIEKCYYWENTRSTKRGPKDRISIASPNWDYIVILEDRGNYMLLITSYPIEYPNKKRKLKKEYQRYSSN